MDALITAVEEAKRRNIPTVVVASTTGKTARRLLELVRAEALAVVVVTHDEGKPPQERRFDRKVRSELEASGIRVYTHNPRNILVRKIIGRLFGRFGFPRWYKHLSAVKEKYGTGIKVCHIITEMLIEDGILEEGRVVAVAGRKSGADSVCIFTVKPKGWPVLEEVIK